MNKKAIFLDIDGTIYSSFGVIPDSAKEAIRKARENGHSLFLNTGRSMGEIPEDIFALGFDGIVGSSGAYVEVNKELIFNQHIDKEVLDKLYDFLFEHGIAFTSETNTKIFGTRENINKEIEVFTKFAKEHLNIQEQDTGNLSIFAQLLTITDDIYNVEGVNKVIFYDSPFSLEELRFFLGKELMVIASTIGFMEGISGEIYSKHINKATGMEQVINCLHILREDTVAFGDAGNDLEMLQFAGIGVAMGNGTKEAKKAADYITKDVKENGLYYGFEKFGLI